MKKCELIRDRIADLFDGSLSPDQRGKLIAHIENCSDCSFYYREMSDLAGMIRSANRPVARKGFSESLVRKIRDSSRQEPSDPLQAMKEFPWKKVMRLAASLLLLSAVALAFILLTYRSPAIAAEKLINRSLLAMLDMKSVQMTFMIRTRELENIDFIDPNGNFIECRLWEAFGNPPKWRMEKAGRMVLMDGKNQYMATAGSGYVLKGGPECGFVNWMKIFLDPAKLLESEKEFARIHGADCRISDQDGRIILTIKAKALGNFSNTFAQNSSVVESDNTRTYTFSKATMFPESMEVTIEKGKERILVIRLEQIACNLPIPDSLLTFIPVKGIPVIPLVALDSINRNGIKDISSVEATRMFFDAISNHDEKLLGRLLPVEALSGGHALQAILKAYAGIRMVKMGKAFRSGLYPGDYVPYVLKLPSGDTAGGNLALRRDNSSHVWNVDGGY